MGISQKKMLFGYANFVSVNREREALMARLINFVCAKTILNQDLMFYY